MIRTIHLAEKDQKENVALIDGNDSEVRGAALHMPTYKQQRKSAHYTVMYQHSMKRMIVPLFSVPCVCLF